MDIKIIKASEKDLSDVCSKLGLREKMESSDVTETVAAIIRDIRDQGDRAIKRYTDQYDGVSISSDRIQVKEEEILKAVQHVDLDLVRVMKKAAKNILQFHQAQKQEDVSISEDGANVRLISRPLDTVGVYVPGGTAPLPSSVLMNVIPAKAVGVRRIVMCTPPRKDGSVDPVILAAAKIAGVSEIYRIGGAQAIAAMAYGTETIPRTDKICGPGNIYVNTAKRLVYGQVDIDLFAGPSEIMIIADHTADPSFVSADLLSQAEHDILASAILVTDNEELARCVADQIVKRAEKMGRFAILSRSLSEYCAIIVVQDLEIAVDFANRIAPEHLELCVKDPEKMLPQIQNAGAVFLGHYSPEALGDYFAGPNHVLPTSGTSRFFSPLNSSDFMKKISVIHYSREALAACYRDVATFAKAEGLEGHEQSVLIRFGRDALKANRSNDQE
jgi:histidinol dehydrogenase